jgi:hypothetical protein
VKAEDFMELVKILSKDSGMLFSEEYEVRTSSHGDSFDVSACFQYNPYLVPKSIDRGFLRSRPDPTHINAARTHRRTKIFDLIRTHASGDLLLAPA